MKTFTVSTELTKPSQSVVTIIGSVRATIVGFSPDTNLLQETVAGDTLSQSFRPELPGDEYPTLNTKPASSSQDSEAYGGLKGKHGPPQIAPGLDEHHGRPRFSGQIPIPNKPLANLGGSDSRLSKIETSYMDWKPEQLANGNYR